MCQFMMTRVDLDQFIQHIIQYVNGITSESLLWPCGAAYGYYDGLPTTSYIFLVQIEEKLHILYLNPKCDNQIEVPSQTKVYQS